MHMGGTMISSDLGVAGSKVIEVIVYMKIAYRDSDRARAEA